MEYCLEGGASFGATWCPSPWCYTSEKCEGAEKGSYFEDVEGPQLYYAYSACGAEDTYTGTLPALACEEDPDVDLCDEEDPCTCTGNQGKGDLQSYYPSDMGNSCKAWDESMDYCLEGGASFGKSWCPSPWCYTSEECEGAEKGSYFE